MLKFSIGSELITTGIYTSHSNIRVKFLLPLDVLVCMYLCTTSTMYVLNSSVSNIIVLNLDY